MPSQPRPENHRTPAPETNDNDPAIHQIFFDRIRTFLAEKTGIDLIYDPDTKGGFFKDVLVSNGNITINRIYRITLGNALHEAGHLAIIPQRFRHLPSGNIFCDEFRKETHDYLENHRFSHENHHENPICRALLQCDDPTATAWSYAAAIAAGVPSTLPFEDPRSYKGTGIDIHAMLQTGGYLGISSLASMQMTHKKLLAKHLKRQPFPAMQRWTN